MLIVADQIDIGALGEKIIYSRAGLTVARIVDAITFGVVVSGSCQKRGVI